MESDSLFTNVPVDVLSNIFSKLAHNTTEIIRKVVPDSLALVEMNQIYWKEKSDGFKARFVHNNLDEVTDWERYYNEYMLATNNDTNNHSYANLLRVIVASGEEGLFEKFLVDDSHFELTLLRKYEKSYVVYIKDEVERTMLDGNDDTSYIVLGSVKDNEDELLELGMLALRYDREDVLTTVLRTMRTTSIIDLIEKVIEEKKLEIIKDFVPTKLPKRKDATVNGRQDVYRCFLERYINGIGNEDNHSHGAMMFIYNTIRSLVSWKMSPKTELTNRIILDTANKTIAYNEQGDAVHAIYDLIIDDLNELLEGT